MNLFLILLITFNNLMINTDVAVSPGLALGKNGEEFVRIELVEKKYRKDRLQKNINRYI